MRAEWKSLTREEERELVLLGQSGQDGDDEVRKRLVADARNRVVMGFYPLVVQSAKRVISKIRNKRTTTADLVQVGMAKILAEFNKFKIERGTRAFTYFIPIGSRAMWEYAVYKDMIIALPSRNLDVMSERCSSAAKKCLTVGSLDYICEFDDSIGDLLVDDDGQADFERRDMLDRITKVIGRLDHRRREIFRLRFIGHTYDDIGLACGITRARVQQIYSEMYDLVLSELGVK